MSGHGAMLAAFTVLALSRIESDIGSAQDAVLGLKAPYDPAWRTFREHGLEEFLKRELPDSQLSPADQRIHRLRRGETALRAHRNLRRSLIAAAVPTATDIGVSIVAIPLVPTLACSMLWSVGVTAIAVALAIVCLVLYGRVVVSVIRGQ